jgi:hypothetical protein
VVQVVVFVVSVWSARRRAVAVFFAESELEPLVIHIAGSFGHRWSSRVAVVAVAGVERAG